MGADVTNNLEYVLMQKLNISALEAKEYIFDMKVNYRGNLNNIYIL